MAAIATALVGVLEAGDHVVAASSLYAATTELLTRDLAHRGVTTTFVDGADTEAFSKAVTPQTKLVYIETPDNPTLGITDTAAVAEVARACGALTFAHGRPRRRPRARRSGEADRPRGQSRRRGVAV